MNGLGEGPMGGGDSSGSQLVASSPSSLFHSLCLWFVHTYSYTALDQILEARAVDEPVWALVKGWEWRRREAGIRG